MNEYPGRYPDLETFVAASSIISFSHLEELCHQRSITVNVDEVNQVTALMTPIEIRDQLEHGCTTITALTHPTFDSLMQVKQRIRDLQLVPIRSDSIQRDYDRMTKDTFLQVVRNCYLSETPIALVKELYPYDIPPEMGQYVVWVHDSNISDYDIAEFIAKIIRISDSTIADVILFERSKMTRTPFVKVAIPEFRHIHMWTKRALKMVT